MSDPVVLVGIRDVLRRLNFLRHNIQDRRVLDEVGMMFIARIQARTAEGKDVDDIAFEPYSPKYKLFRAKTGRTTEKVNLFYTGSMMSSMTHEATKDQVTLFFANTEDPSGTKNPLKAYFLNQERRFFAINSEDRVRALDIINRHIRRQLRRRR